MTIADNPLAVSVDASIVGSPAVVRLTGELDMAYAPELDACLLAHADGDIIVDLAGLTNHGFEWPQRPDRRSHTVSGTWTLTRAAGTAAQVGRLLKITGTDQIRARTTRN
jgi:hypothetical protein